MARDIKTNYMQHTPKQLEKMVARYLGTLHSMGLLQGGAETGTEGADGPDAAASAAEPTDPVASESR